MSYNKFLFVFLILSFTSCNFKSESKISQQPKKNEAYYTNVICNNLNGKAEHRLTDNTRIDCLTQKYAIELDWANKWHEGITQALYYAMKSGKEAKLVLLTTRKDDKRFYKKSIDFVGHYELPILIELFEVN